MADAGHGLSIGDWLQLIIGTIMTAIVAGIGGAMTWFSKTKAGLVERMKDIERSDTAQSMEIAVLKTQHDHTAEELSIIRETTRDTNQKVDAIMGALLDLKQGRE